METPLFVLKLELCFGNMQKNNVMLIIIIFNFCFPFCILFIASFQSSFKKLNLEQKYCIKKGIFHILYKFIEGDERTQSLADDINKLSKKRKAKRRQLTEEGIKNLEDFGLSENDVNNIFDILDAEFEDL